LDGRLTYDSISLETLLNYKSKENKSKEEPIETINSGTGELC
jgi:hypothetical protein